MENVLPFSTLYSRPMYNIPMYVIYPCIIDPIYIYMYKCGVESTLA